MSRNTVLESDLLSEINEFLRKTGMSPTRFGTTAIGDPSLVADLAKGRELRRKTRAKVRAILDAPAPRQGKGAA